MTEIQRIVADLQRALDIRVVTGVISLNLHESELRNVKIEMHQTVVKRNPLTTTTAEPNIRHTR